MISVAVISIAAALFNSAAIFDCFDFLDNIVQLSTETATFIFFLVFATMLLLLLASFAVCCFAATFGKNICFLAGAVFSGLAINF